MLTCRVASSEEMRRLGEALGALLGPGDVVGLIGELGAGKTVLAQGVALGLGVRARVTSPTFTIIHEHRGRVPFYHVDVYRLGAPSDTEGLGLEEYLSGDGVAAVEWADKIEALLPPERLDVEIGIGAGGDWREVSFIPRGARFERMLEELRISCACWDSTRPPSPGEPRSSRTSRSSRNGAP